MSTIVKEFDWVIDASEMRIGKSIVKNLGPAFEDNWTLAIELMTRGRVKIIFKREKAVHETYCYIKFLFKSSGTNVIRRSDFQKKFIHSCNSRITWFLNRKICTLIHESKILEIKMEIEFYLAPNQDLIMEPVLSTVQQSLGNLSSDLSNLCCNNLLSDVVLACESEVFPAHKLILSARCPILAERLKHTNSEDVKVNIDDIKSDVLKNILLFIYSGKIEIKDIDYARNLINAANKYHLNELKQVCENYIQSLSFVESVSKNEISSSSYSSNEFRSYKKKFKCKNENMSKQKKKLRENFEKPLKIKKEIYL